MTLKLHFEPDLDYQRQAIDAVCDLFAGQEVSRNEFTVERAAGSLFAASGVSENELGIGNRLKLLDDQILANLRAVQLRHGLRPADALASGDFTVEMETGTGKTYVYLRTIFELNRRYGFTKFVIVLPSVAIKEGVYKTLQITEEHWKSLYGGVAFDYFLYDSAKLGQVRAFATSSHVQIMVMTIQSIRAQKVAVMYKDSEKTGGERPIDLVKATRPVVIVDEPQSVDGGIDGEGRRALSDMNPLCTLRYSATHADKHHMVYRLDAVDAYEHKLVKQIEVAAADVQGAHNKPYVELVSVHNRRNQITAKLRLDVQRGTSVAREVVTVKSGALLDQETKREIYAGYQVENIRCKAGDEHIALTNQEQPLRVGHSIGGVDTAALHRLLIRRTIEEHLEKERRFAEQHGGKPAIKVLSLFFVDAVESYRSYGAEGEPQKGPLARIFEEEYASAAKKPKFASLFHGVDLATNPAEVHEGYFSIDRRGRVVDTAENNAANRENAERAYNLIMRDKEKLLSFETKLKFIFSHSALREGWDNPNVFQICVLREMASETQRRQTIGRGLRICVNQAGERVRGDVNTLTVIATESYEQFAAGLQQELEDSETGMGIRFGVVESHAFANIAVPTADGTLQPLGVAQSEKIFEHLKSAGLVNAKGEVQDALRTALKNGTLALPEAFAAQLPQVREILRKLAGKLDIKNADERRPVKTREKVLHGEEFRELWDRIKHKTTYRVHFDNEQLIANCTKALKDAPEIAKSRLQWRKADVAIGRGGVSPTPTTESAWIAIEEKDIVLPDLLGVLQDRTQLTRRSLVRILRESGRLPDFVCNPQQFIEVASEAISRAKRHAIVAGIKYTRIGDDAFYAQELFESEELTGYLKNMLASVRSVYEYVVYDSATVEKTFAEQLEKNEAVRVYAKLPGWFKVPTPLGTYNPDWAVLAEKDGGERLYFVVETKGVLFEDALRPVEAAKLACGRAHFNALMVREAPAEYVVATKWDDLASKLV